MNRWWRIPLYIVLLFLLALAEVWTAGRLSPGYTLDLGPQEWGRIEDANDWEDNGRFTFRWTEERTRFRLPVLGTPRQAVLRLDGSRPAGAAAGAATLSLDGQTTLRFTPAPGPHLYFVLHDRWEADRWETVVTLESESFSPPNDPRALGVVVDRIHFSPPLRRPDPAWALVALWTAVGLAAVALGEVLGWPWGWAGGTAALLQLLLSLLLAWSRPVALPWAGLLLATLLIGAVVAWAYRRRQPAPKVLQEGAAGESRERIGPFGRTCLALALLVAALPLLTPWLPRGASWSLHVLEPFYPAAGPVPRTLQRLLPLLLVGVAALPAVNRDLRQSVEQIWKLGRRLTPRLRPAGRWLLLGLLFVPLGYALRSQILWGDGPHLIAHIGAGYRFKESEMLALFAHALLYRGAESLWGWSVPDVYTLTSLVLGALYVALAGALSDSLGRSRLERATIFGLLVTLATIQFGFGYLENYGLITVALLALLWQMVRVLQGGGSLAGLGALWVVACASHLQALLVGPAVLYTVAQRAKRAVPGRRWRPVGAAALGGVIAAGLLMGLFVVGGYDLGGLLAGDWVRGNSPYFFVPLRNESTYTLFSLRHLANVVNEHLLVAPVVLPLLLLVGVWYRRRIRWRDPLLVALGLSAAGLLLFASLLYPDLGPAMDWDLFAPAAIPYTLLAGLLFNRAVPEDASKGYAATVLLVSQGVHTALWVLLNAGLR